MRDLCIHHGLVLTMDQPGTIIDHGRIGIHDGRIVYCGPDQADPTPLDGYARVLDARGGVIMPGLINGHTHAAMTLLRGLADDLPLETWLTQHIFPAERHLTPEAVYWGSLLACAEMIKSGTTSLCDMYLFAGQVGRAVEEAGLRAVIGEVIYDFPSPSYGELDNGFRVTEELLTAYRGHPRISVAVMPHAPYTCSPPLWERAGRMAADYGADINTHLAETKVETAQILERYGKRPLDFLAGLGLVNQRLWIDHGVDLNQAEIERLAAAGARAALCTESNLKLASGLADLPAMLAAGLKAGLGTDGCASNNDLDLFGEMDTCAKVHKLVKMDPTAVPARTVLELCTRRAGLAFGRDDLGELKVGALADVIVIDTDQPHLTPMYNPYSHLVYAARGGDVMHSVCHGRVLMADRVLETLDQTEVLAKAREQAAALVGRNSA